MTRKSHPWATNSSAVRQADGTLSMTPKGVFSLKGTPRSRRLWRQCSTMCMAASQSSTSVTMGNITRSGPRWAARSRAQIWVSNWRGWRRLLRMPRSPSLEDCTP